MPTFLWSGKTPAGQEEAEEVSAESAMEARKILEARGWTELRQHTTEIHDFVRRQIRESNPNRVEPRLTPKERLQFHQGTAPGLWSKWFDGLWQSAVTILVLAGFLGATIYDRRVPGDKFLMVIFAFLLAFTVFLYPVLRWWFRQTKRLFVRMYTAKTWQRWGEVLKCLDGLAKAQQSTNSGIGDYEMERYRATALIGLGRVDEGMAVYSAAAEKADTPQVMRHTFQASIHTLTKEYDKGLQCYRLALNEATDKSTVCLDMGMYLVQRFNRPQEARELLAQAEKMQLSELARVYVGYLRGVIAFRERDYPTMDKCLQETLASFEKRATAKFYIYEGSILTCQGYLAVSSAALGRTSEARKYFAQSVKYLKLRDFNDVVAEYERLMANSKPV